MVEPIWQGIKLSKLEGMVKVLTFGAEKYAEDNWMFVPNLRKRYFSALMRHLVSWAKGDIFDDESGLNHLHHCLCNAYFLMYEAKYGVPNKAPKSLDKFLNEIKEDLEQQSQGLKFDSTKPKWHLVDLNLIRESVQLIIGKTQSNKLEDHYRDLVQHCSYFNHGEYNLEWAYGLFNKVITLVMLFADTDENPEHINDKVLNDVVCGHPSFSLTDEARNQDAIELFG